MSDNEPSEERIEKAARAIWELNHPNPPGWSAWGDDSGFGPDESERKLIRQYTRAALLADAPALVEARIAGMRSAANIIRDNGVRYSQDGTSLCPRPDGDQSGILYAEAIEADIAAIRAELDNERGKTT